MVRKISFILFSLQIVGCSFLQQNMDLNIATSAGKDLYKAATLDDDDIKKIAAGVVQSSDRSYKVASASTPQGARLAKVSARLQNIDGKKMIFKAYYNPEMNAFAVGDGNIRVYTGLIDKMTDDELFFILGHEVGHVMEGHSKSTIRTAYLVSAAKKGIGAQYSTIGDITHYVAGDILEQLVNAQFSQSQEEDADDYGFELMEEHKVNQRAAISALKKLGEGGDGGGMFSTHPASSERAARLAEDL